jgi:hypothetical protein
MHFTKSQSQLIEYALEELLNSDDFSNLPTQAHSDMKILLNKFFDLTKSFN